MKIKLGQDPAFPNEPSPYMEFPACFGMTKRFYAACAAMQGLVSNHVYMASIAKEFKEDIDKVVIKDAYELADELLKQEDLK